LARPRNVPSFEDNGGPVYAAVDPPTGRKKGTQQFPKLQLTKQGGYMTQSQSLCRLHRNAISSRIFGITALLMIGTSSGALAQSAAPTTAPAANSDTTPTDIVVTARKRVENLQNVPLSITALSASDLSSAGVQDLRDITFQTPGLTFTTGAGANYYSKPIIRGQTDLGGVDNNVPVFFDGVYISNTSAIDFGIIDLARVEVIEGPVSATYGRSAYAGAINYVTAKPTDHFSAQFKATGGDYGKYAFSGLVSGPIAGDILKGGISASYDHFDGTFHDPATNANAGGYVKRDFSANLDFTPNEHLEIRPFIYYGNDQFGSEASVFGPANCGSGYSATFCGNFPSGTVYGPYVANGSQYGQTGNSRKVLIGTLTIDLKYDWGTISSLTGWGEYNTSEYNEFDDQSFGLLANYYALPTGATVGSYPTAANQATFGTNPVGQAYVPLHFGYTDRNRDFSEELRFTTKQTGPIKGSIGGYYATTHHTNSLGLAQGTCSIPAGNYIVDFFATPCGQVQSNQVSAYDQNDSVKAVFGSLDWDIVKDLTFSTELRYSSTKSNYLEISAIFNPFPAEGYSTSGSSALYPLGTTPETATFNDVTSRTSLTYKPSHDLTIYASAANGSKIGGFNNSTVYPSYKPEKNWTFEIGFKSQFMDNKIGLNADVYLINATDYQIYAPAPGGLGGFYNSNYGGLRTKGAEISAWAKLASWAKLSGGVGITDPKFKSDAYDFGDYALCGSVPGCSSRLTTAAGVPAVSLNGLRPPYESNFTFNAALDVRYPVAEGYTGIFRADYRHESPQFYQYPIDAGSFGPLNVVNLRVGVEKGPISLVAYVRNLTNNLTPETVQDSAVTGATNFQATYFPVAVLPDRRNFGVTLTYKFGR
jgi:iron complex outermembrane receptor protein